MDRRDFLKGAAAVTAAAAIPAAIAETATEIPLWADAQPFCQVYGIVQFLFNGEPQTVFVNMKSGAPTSIPLVQNQAGTFELTRVSIVDPRDPDSCARDVPYPEQKSDLSSGDTISINLPKLVLS